MNRSAGRRHQDVKSRTMNRYTSLDPDIGSKWDDVEDEDNSVVRYKVLSYKNNKTIKDSMQYTF